MLELKLVENPDILKEISCARSTCVAGFCAESENLLENAKVKIQKKGCDFLIANDISRKDIGFNTDENEVYIIDKSLNIKHIEKIPKKTLLNAFWRKFLNKYDIVRKIEEFAPLETQESWDCSGWGVELSEPNIKKSSSRLQSPTML